VVNRFSEKNSRFDATRCQILRLKCTKFDFRWGFAPDPAEGSRSPGPLAVFKGAFFQADGGKMKREGEGKRRGKGEKGIGCKGKGQPHKYLGLKPPLVNWK